MKSPLMKPFARPTSTLHARIKPLIAIAAAGATALGLAACTTTGTREAPIVDKSTRVGERRPEPARGAPVAPVSTQPSPIPSVQREAREGNYVIQRGDTLYSIALAFGQDFRDLARWNGLDDPARIAVGQTLRVVPPDGDNAAAGAGVASTVPIQPIGSVESRPLSGMPAPTPLPPVGGSGSGGVAASPPAASPPPVAAASGPVVGSGAPASAASSAPMGEPASPGWAGGAKPGAGGATAGAGAPGSPSPVAPVVNTPAPTAPVISGGAAAATKPADPAAEIAKGATKPAVPDAPVGWAWPVTGKVIEEFHETRNKGIDISGKEGDSVLAANDGQVVYSGSGLRGYGNLVIVKHTDDYISAYAHNRQIVVKQGQPVKRGQKIAELGKSDAETPKLHFEIRRQGKPVDPLKYLPPR